MYTNGSKHMKRRSTAYVIFDMKQWGTTTHLSEWPKSKTRTPPNADEDMEHQEFSFPTDGKAKRFSHLKVQQFLRKLNILLSSDPAITSFGIYPNINWKLMFTQKNCSLMFTAALLITAKSWKQPGCPSVVEQINRDNEILFGTKQK